MPDSDSIPSNEKSSLDSYGDTDYEMDLFDEIRSNSHNIPSSSQNREFKIPSLTAGKQVVFDQIMVHVQTVYMEKLSGQVEWCPDIVSCTNGNSSGQQQIPTDKKSSSQTPSSSTKRKRISEGEENNDGGNEQNKRRKPPGPGASSIALDTVKFACQYLKNDHNAYNLKDWKSCHMSYSSIARLK